MTAEIVRLFMVRDDSLRAEVENGMFLYGQPYYLSSLPEDHQQRIALIKLLPESTYIIGIGGITNTGVIVLNTIP